MNNLVRDLGGMAGRQEFTATVAGKTGDIVFTGSGQAGYVCDTADHAIGDSVAITTDALVEVDAAGATTFAVGATVNYNTTTKLAVASGTAGTSAIGKAERAKVADEITVLVRFNR
jgi:predicted RecA/RadA family phage recombinase